MNFKSLKKNITNSFQTTDGWYNAVKKICWLYLGNKTSNAPATKKTLINFKFPAPIGKVNLKVRYNNGSDSFIISEVFQEQCYFLAAKSPVVNIVDLGANAGFTAIYFSKLFPGARIACVEPMPNNLEVLRENLMLNTGDFVVFEGAISVDKQKVVMESGDKDYGNKVHGIPYGKEFKNDTLIVNGLTMDHLLDTLNWNRIDLLKIDIEGYEGILLKENNAWLSKVNILILEIHEGVTIDFVKSITDTFGLVHTKLQKGNWILSRKEII